MARGARADGARRQPRTGRCPSGGQPRVHRRADRQSGTAAAAGMTATCAKPLKSGTSATGNRLPDMTPHDPPAGRAQGPGLSAQKAGLVPAEAPSSPHPRARGRTAQSLGSRRADSGHFSLDFQAFAGAKPRPAAGPAWAFWGPAQPEGRSPKSPAHRADPGHGRSTALGGRTARLRTAKLLKTNRNPSTQMGVPRDRSSS